MMKLTRANKYGIEEDDTIFLVYLFIQQTEPQYLLCFYFMAVPVSGEVKSVKRGVYLQGWTSCSGEKARLQSQ